MTSLYTFCRKIVEQGPSSPPEWAAFAVLWLLSCPYRAVVTVRRWMYARGLKSVYRASVPVISVGNLSAGGTGKTPFTDLLVKRFVAEGFVVAVVSRGYGGTFRGEAGLVAEPGGQPLMHPAECGDEPFLLSRKNPDAMVFVARKRRLGVQAAEERGAEVIILDDGFQHLAVHRDLNIVLLDARAPFGNGQMLPAGRLREPVSTLDQSSLIVLTHAEDSTEIVLPVDTPVVRCCHKLSEHLVSLEGERCSWGLLRGQKNLAFAGIAQPENFFAALQKCGVTLEKTVSFNDHQSYGADVLNRLHDACHNCDLLITTEKDAVKLDPAALPRPCYGVPMELDIIDGRALEPALETIRKRIRNEFE